MGINETQKGYLTSKFTKLVYGLARVKTQITHVSNSSLACLPVPSG